MQDYSAGEWVQLAGTNGLGSFESLWGLDIGWFEEPNQRRGGWSGVSRTDLACPGGGSTGVFIKRQQDHTTRTPMHPLAGVLTFRREFQNLNRLYAAGVPTLEVLYFAQRRVAGKRRAILITRELSGYQSLFASLETWRQNGWPGRRAWLRCVRQLAGITRLMHESRIQHNCLFPKHVFLANIDTELEIRLIDLEKAKHTCSVEQAMLRDLDTLNRHTLYVTAADRLRFLLAYHGRRRVDDRVRRTWKKLIELRRMKTRSPAGG